jgi:Tol biopolymer transport system component
VALVCNNRVWISDADGSDQVPLTATGWNFSDLHWSPDGRWLLTTWWHGSEGGALYLLAADGSGGRLLIDNPSLYVFPIGWSPDGRQVVYNVYRGAANSQVSVWTTDIETGETHPLPGVPTWSPDGQHLVYVAESPDARGNVVWLSDADWENPRPLVDLAELGPQGAWSPDSSQLALTLLDQDPARNAVVLYDLASGNITPLITIADMAEIAASSVRANLGDIIIQDADPDALGDSPLQSLWPLGWSADGSHLLVWAQASDTVLNVVTPAVLAVVTLDGSSPRVLAYGNGGFYGDASWSPTNPDQLTFSWPTEPRLAGGVSYLYDLNSGPIYTAPQSWNAAWSPDGAWLAFSGQNPVTIVSQQGYTRFSPEPDSSCTTLVWNPAADLSALGQTVPLTLTLASSEDAWRFENVHIEQNQLDSSLHVWGEVVNHSGDNQRIISFVPFIQNKYGQPVHRGQSVFFPIDFRALIRSVGLADGQGIPFDFTLHLLPKGTWLEGETEIVVRVVSELAEPVRGNLDIIPDELDFAGQIDALYVSGVWENTGPDLNEHAAVVVTVYGDEGQVLGWGWHDETDPARLISDRHDFKVQITLSETVTDLDQASSYKVQLFAR